jgi:hypothetical protein
VAATVAEPLNAPFPRPEPREPDLQAQVDDLRLALRDWRRQREYSDTTQKRLEQITLQCAQLVESWQLMQRRGGAAGTAPALTGRVAPGTGERIRALERAIESEWEAIPTGDDSARQISEQAASLVESCVTATNLALRGFENAENRLAAMERDIQSGLSQLSRDLQQVLAEIRSGRQGAPPASPFPLEGVMRIHQELRDGDPVGAEAPPAIEARGTRTVAAESTRALAERVETLERTVERVTEEPAPAPPRRSWLTPAALTLLIVLTTVALLGIWLQRRIDARLAEAAAQVAAAERQRDAAVAETRQEAARQVTDAQRGAAQAQIVGTVMAAPDLVRYWLSGLGESRAYAHVLISRSRGLVFSASRLRQPAEGQTYQLWLLTSGGTVNAGTVTPDAQGRATLATEAPIILPGRLTGAVVTLEAGASVRTPSADRVLVQID